MSRVLGLDVVRALAILLVMVGHLGIHGLLDNNYVMYLFGFYGVELFFVLSGFLIGQILIKLFLKSFSFDDIKRFWMRRWLRTLPLYYLILTIRILTESPSTFPFLHFFFLQNSQIITEYNNQWFGESWSLTVEEFFYLIFPIILWLFSKLSNTSVKKFSFSLFFVILVSVMCRLLLVYMNSTIDFETNIRKFTFLRLDSLAQGVLIAGLKIIYPSIYKKFQNKLIAIVSIIIILLFNIFGNILVYDFNGIKTFPSTIGILLNSILLSLVLPFFDSVKTNFLEIKNKWIKFVTQFFQKTALYSYCIYLIHIPIYNLIIKSSTVNHTWIIQVIIAWIMIYALTHISYKYFELPILKFRDKKFPG